MLTPIKVYSWWLHVSVSFFESDYAIILLWINIKKIRQSHRPLHPKYIEILTFWACVHAFHYSLQGALPSPLPIGMRLAFAQTLCVITGFILWLSCALNVLIILYFPFCGDEQASTFHLANMQPCKATNCDSIQRRCINLGNAACSCSMDRSCQNI